MGMDYLESLFKGIDIIVGKRLEEISYDKTIVCTITDDSNRKNGEYVVTDGTMTFKAYSENDTYKVDDQVRVQIPLGDFTRQKYIIGKHIVSADNLPLTYVSPLERLVNISGNLMNGVFGKQWSIGANGGTISPLKEKREKTIWNIKIDEKSQQLQKTSIYTAIGLRADFKTLLENSVIKYGNYGLRLDLYVKPTYGSGGYIRHWVELDCSEMIGDPYSFSIYTTQEKLFDISGIPNIVGMELVLYQKDNFVTFDGVAFEPLGPDNIYVKDIELLMGSDLSAIADNTLTIYTTGDSFYSPTDNIRDLNLVWYNKDQEGQYVGFSDGIYEETKPGEEEYDEFKYILASRGDARLEAQIGRDGIPTDVRGLTLAANLEDIEKHIKILSETIGVDISASISKLEQLTQGAPDDFLLDHILGSEAIIPLNGNGSCASVANTIDGFLNSLKNTYDIYLRYGYNKQNFISQETPDFPSENFANKIKTTVASFATNLGTFITTLIRKKDMTKYSAYVNILEIYIDQLEKSLQKLKAHYLNSDLPEDSSYKELFESFYNDDFSKLKEYAKSATYPLVEYQRADIDEQLDRYCVYWYKYNEDYEEPEDDELVFLSPGWELMEKFDSGKNIWNNYGLPEPELEKRDGKQYYQAKLDPSVESKKVPLDGEKQEQKFKAILFHNHEIYISNELIFTNKVEIIDEDALNKKNAVSFEHLLDSYSDYQIYTHTNALNNQADALKQRQIRAHYNNLQGRVNDEKIKNGRIYWYVPVTSSMLDVDDAYLLARGFQSDGIVSDAAEAVNLAQQIKDFGGTNIQTGTNIIHPVMTVTQNVVDLLSSYTKSTVNFKAKAVTLPSWASQISDGVYQIYSNILDDIKTSAYTEKLLEPKIPEYSKVGYRCYYKNITYNEELKSFFTTMTLTDEAGTPYTEDIDCRDFWYKVKPYYSPAATQNMIICEIYFDQAQSSAPVQGAEIFTFGTTSTNGTKYSYAIMPLTRQCATTNAYDLPLKVSLKDGDNRPVDVIGSSFGESMSWLMGSNGGDAIATNTDGIGLQFKNENLSNPTQNSVLTGAVITKKYFGILKAISRVMVPGRVDPDDPTKDKSGTSRPVTLETLYAVPWSSERYSYMSGPTYIVYNSLGQLDGYSLANTSYSLYNGLGIKQNVTWSMEYYNQQGKKYGEGEKIPDKECLPTIEENILVPAAFFPSSVKSYAVAVAKNESKEVIWRQPIITIQNRFPCTILNEWDGTLDIDKNNGTIMSVMVGAGRKHEDNSFSGVLMGDIQKGTSGQLGFDGGESIGLANQFGVGLYGFHKGAQSFGFNSDGTAFIGKSGSGRIIFNGDWGVIASANWFDTGDGTGGMIDINGDISPGTKGMCIDLENGHIDAYNFKLTSKNIYLDSSGFGWPNKYYYDSDYQGYYMYIGNDKEFFCCGPTDKSDDPNIKMSIRVSDFDLTGVISEEDLKDTNLGKTLSAGFVSNSAFNRSEILSRLSLNYTQDGIYVENGRIYLCATHMAIGSIQSKNLQYTWTEKTNVFGDTVKTVSAISKGTIFDLDSGAFASANCKLDLWSSILDVYNYDSEYNYTDEDARFILRIVAGYDPRESFEALSEDKQTELLQRLPFNSGTTYSTRAASNSILDTIIGVIGGVVGTVTNQVVDQLFNDANNNSAFNRALLDFYDINRDGDLTAVDARLILQAAKMIKEGTFKSFLSKQLGIQFQPTGFSVKTRNDTDDNSPVTSFSVDYGGAFAHNLTICEGQIIGKDKNESGDNFQIPIDINAVKIGRSYWYETSLEGNYESYCREGTDNNQYRILLTPKSLYVKRWDKTVGTPNGANNNFAAKLTKDSPDEDYLQISGGYYSYYFDWFELARIVHELALKFSIPRENSLVQASGTSRRNPSYIKPNHE